MLRRDNLLTSDTKLEGHLRYVCEIYFQDNNEITTKSSEVGTFLSDMLSKISVFKEDVSVHYDLMKTRQSVHQYESSPLMGELWNKYCNQVKHNAKILGLERHKTAPVFSCYITSLALCFWEYLNQRNLLKYTTVENFLAVYPQFAEQDSRIVDYYCLSANIIDCFSYFIKPASNKTWVLQYMLSRLTIGRLTKYKPGGGTKASSTGRNKEFSDLLHIYEHEGNITAVSWSGKRRDKKRMLGQQVDINNTDCPSTNEEKPNNRIMQTPEVVPLRLAREGSTSGTGIIGLSESNDLKRCAPSSLSQSPELYFYNMESSSTGNSPSNILNSSGISSCDDILALFNNCEEDACLPAGNSLVDSLKSTGPENNLKNLEVVSSAHPVASPAPTHRQYLPNPLKPELAGAYDTYFRPYERSMMTGDEYVNNPKHWVEYKHRNNGVSRTATINGSTGYGANPNLPLGSSSSSRATSINATNGCGLTRSHSVGKHTAFIMKKKRSIDQISQNTLSRSTSINNSLSPLNDTSNCYQSGCFMNPSSCSSNSCGDAQYFVNTTDHGYEDENVFFGQYYASQDDVYYGGSNGYGDLNRRGHGFDDDFDML